MCEKKEVYMYMTTHGKTKGRKESKRKKTGENHLEIRRCRDQEMISDMIFQIRMQ
jgi:hypothetical protein